MATADTARLIAVLELQDKFSKTADKAVTKVDRIDKKLGAFSGALNRNLGRAVDATISRGVRAFTGAVTDGLGSLAELEDATTSVDAAIAKTGKTGKVTSGQIAVWANEIEASTQAAFDDKAITAATADLIRYGKVTTSNIKPAMKVMTDLAARTGSVESASKLLAKALADPEKAMGALRKAGVILNKDQQKHIATLVKEGKKTQAQRYLLQQLARTTAGAAAASQGKYRDSLNLMADASEDAKKALAEGFFPVVQRVSDKVAKLAADPQVLAGLRSFGNNVADAFDKAITFAEGVDWKSMGDGLKVAFDWGRKLFDVFASMPPEAKGAIIALAGLNKLSGGAVTGIVSEIGKGLIKGVLGMTAGVVNLKAGIVKGGGGVGGGTPGVEGGGTGKLGKALAAASIVGDIVAVVATQQAVSAQNSQIAADIHQSLSEGIKTKTPAELITALNGVNQGINDIQANPLNVLVSGSALDELRGMRAELSAQLGNSGTGANFATHGGDKWKADSAALGKAIQPTTDAVVQSQGVLDQSILKARDATADAKREIASKVSAGTIIGSNATRQSGALINSQSIGNTNRIVGAFSSIPAPIVNVDVRVSGMSVTKSQTTTSRSSQSSSRSDDNYNDHR